MIKRIEVTEDLLKVIPIIFLQEKNGFDNKTITIDSSHMYSIGFGLMEDLAMALGIYDRAIKGTEDDPEGKAFSEEDTNRILSLHKYIVDNLYYIEALIHQYVVKGGLEVGVYKAKDNELIFEKES
jgi:alpha-D-ribose 1-methylphosphonate 5-triphosphate synthase subunit PhnI